MQSIISWVSAADADSLTALAIDAVLKSTVLLILAAVIAGLLRRASAAVRHRLWCLTFVGLLLLPLLSYALPAWRIPVLPPVAEPELAADDVADPQISITAEPPVQPALIDDRIDSEFILSQRTAWPTDSSMQMPEFDGALLPPVEPAVVDVEQSATPEVILAVTTSAAPPRSLVWSLPVLSLWIAGCLLVLTPLIVGLAHSAWIGVRASRITDAAWTGLLNELRGRLQLSRRVTLLELQRPVIPMTWGVLRPVVIVPESAQRWPERLRRFVLLHELAHVKRWDVPFQLLGRVACAMYWFHPLAWYALRRLRIERELACDDCVVTTGERPSDYAEQLVQIVRTCRPAGFASVGVAMARTSHLEGRIRALFDRARSHVPLSARGARALSLAAALLVTTVAVVRPSNREAEPEEPVASVDVSVDEDRATSEETAAVDTEVVTDPPAAAIDVKSIRLQGRVTRDANTPLAGASLRIVRLSYFRGGGVDVEPVELGVTDAGGRFDCAYEPDSFYGMAGEQFLVTAEGMGPEWLSVAEAAELPNIELRLAVDDVPMEGRILDLEGNPVAGVEVSVGAIHALRGGDLTSYIEAVKADGGDNFQFDQHLFKPAHLRPQTTDADGRFHLAGIGPERIVDLELAGKGIHHAQLRVMTRRGEPVVPDDEDTAQRGQQYGHSPVFGAEFSYLVQPSRPIRGIVVDAETKTPLAGVNIGTLEGRGRATSGADGRFELDGCAKADEYLLLASAVDGQPYLVGSQRVADRPGLDPLEVTIELTRGVAIKRRVNDEATGQPVAAAVSYWPAFPNPSMRPGIGGFEAHALGAFSESHTDREGEATVVVLPGAGFICVRANDQEAYERANVDAAAFFRGRGVPYYSAVEMSNESEPILITAVSDSVSSGVRQSSFNAIELLNVDPDVEQAEQVIEMQATSTSGEKAVSVRPSSTDPGQTPSGPVTVRGTVVDPAGKPVAGATVQVVRVKRSHWVAAPPSTTVATTVTTSAAGRFEFPLDSSKVGNHTGGPLAEWIDVIATAPGHGFGYGSILKPGNPVGPASITDLAANRSLQIQLPPPQAIRGRVVDIEGRPIVGASLQVFSVGLGGSTAKVDEWLDKVHKLPVFDRDVLGRLPPVVEAAEFPRTETAEGTTALFPPIQTDAEGRFELDGIGRDRVAVLMLNGPGLAQSLVQVLSRPLDQPVRAVPVTHLGDSMTFHGAEFTVVAAPSVPVSGAVRDAETHEPIAGAQIVLSHLAGTRFQHDGFIAATTDAQGRYELQGLPLGEGNAIKVIPVNQPYLASLEPTQLPEVLDLRPIVQDFDLRKAVWVTGRLHDELTGAPVQGTVHYTPVRGNEHAAQYPQFADQGLTYALGNDRYYVTDADGRFRIPVTPGRGVLCALALDQRYCTGNGAEKIAELLPKYPKDGNEGLFPTLGLISPDYFHGLREINPPVDADEVTVDLPLHAGISQELVFVDAAGEPVTGVYVTGVNQGPIDGPNAATNRVTAVGLKEGETQTVRAWQNDRKLGIQLEFMAARDAGPQTIVLHPPVKVSGRLIDPQGSPLAEGTIETRYQAGNSFNHSLEDTKPDETGAFTVDLYAGATYQLLTHGDKFTILSNELATRLGESIDLGDLVIDPKGNDFSAAVPKRAPIVTKSSESASALPASATAPTFATAPARSRAMNRLAGDGAAHGGDALAAGAPQATAATPQTTTVRGTVVDPAGKPVAGARVRVVHGRESPFYAAPPTSRVLMTLETSETGEFEFPLPKLDMPESTARRLNYPEWHTIVANAPGYGFSFAHAATASDGQPLKLQLAPEQKLRGRVVDLEGRPIEGATVRVFDVAFGESSAKIDEWLAGLGGGATFNDRDLIGPASPGLEKLQFPGYGNRQISPDLFPTLKTDADGRFELDGIGRDRVAVLEVTGSDIAKSMVQVLARPLEHSVQARPVSPFGNARLYHGADFTFAAGPASLVTGVVRDLDSHEPIAGAMVVSTSIAGTIHSHDGYIVTTTDVNGRYELRGFPLGKGNRLKVIPGDQPYLITDVIDVPEIKDSQPVNSDIELPRAVWATGRLFDESNGEPVQGTVFFSPFIGNESAVRYPQYADQTTHLIGNDRDYRTDIDGRFRIPVTPGRGVLCAMADSDAYRTAYGAEQIAELAPFIDDPNFGRAPTFDHIVPQLFHSLREIDPPADADEFAVDLPVKVGITLDLRFTDPAGDPLTRVVIVGAKTMLPQASPSPADRATVIGLTDGKPINFYARQYERNLGVCVELTPGPETGPQTIVLQPPGVIRGRLVDPHDEPIAEASIESRGRKSIGTRVTTDEDGEFSMELLSGQKYQLLTRIKNFVVLAEELAPNTGETIDLGDLVVDPDGKNWGTATPKRPPIVTKSADAADAKPAGSGNPVSTAPRASASESSPRAIRRPVAGGSAAAIARADTKAAAAAASQSNPQTITVRGSVLDPDGKPVAGAAVRAQTPLWAMLKPLVPDGWEPPIIETKSAADGAFEISFSTQPMGDLSGLNPQWAEIWKKTVIAASAPGFGPAWLAYDEIKEPDQPVTLKLVEDLPIEGRIVDLEGAPLAGETIKISDLRAAENEDLSPWLAAITAGEPPWTAWKQAPRSIDPQLVGVPEAVTSDPNGRFEIRGVGRERHLNLTFQSESVAWKNVQVVTRLMEPVKAVISTPPFEAVEPVFGARFVFAATPARIVTGTVRDAKTGSPMAAVSVESYKLADYPYSNHRVLKTVTDPDGRFRLIGMPKGDGNQVLVVPNDDQPYFMREFNIPDPDGIEPVDVTIDLHRGIWITGRVTDAASGQPVPARVHYLPYRTNAFAEALPEFDDNGNGNGDQMRFQTQADGTYRLVGLPGPAVIGAESVLKDYPMGQGYAELPGPKEGNTNWIATYRNPINPGPKWPTAMTYIDPPADAQEVTVDFRLEAGSSVAIRLVDPEGQPLSGVEVTGRLSRLDPGAAIDGAEFEAINLGADEERTVLFQHKERGLGWVQRIKASDAATQPIVVKLQPVATITGQLLTSLGDPITGMEVEAVPLPGGDFHKQLPSVTTRQDGRFSYTILPGAKYTIQGRGGGFVYSVLAKDLAIEPGQTIDLGDLRIDKDGKVMETPAGDATKAKPAAMSKAQTGATALASASPAPEPAANKADAPPQSDHSYSGRVTDTNGKPLAGATVWLAIDTGDAEHEQLLRIVATSDQDGKFRFTLDPEARRLIDAFASHPWIGSLLAVAPARGFDWLPLAVFEDNPALTSRRDELIAHLTSTIGAERLESRSLRLRSAPRAVRGQLVDLEGRPRPNVVVRVESVMQPDVRLLLQSFEEKSKQRYFDSVNATSVGGDIDRLHVYRLFPPVTTDADGRFELAGVGEDQLAKLSINAAGVEAQVIHILGRPIESARLPHFDSYPGGAKDVFYGWDFTHAVGPSIPVVGVVKEFDSGEPIANTLVRVERLFSEGGGADEGQVRVDTQHLRAMTDADGRFRIDGLPPGIGHVLEAKPPITEPYLMASQNVSLSQTDAPVKEIEIQVKKTFWIEGRVTDKQTGAPVVAYVDYLALEQNPHTLDKMGLRQAWEIHRYRTDSDGRYRVPGLPGPGVVMVLAIDGPGYPRSVGAETVDGYDKDSRYFLTNPVGYPLSNWNLIQQIDPAVDAATFTCDFELDAGQEVAGRVVGPDGAAVSNFSALGEVVKEPFWKRHADGQFSVLGYDGQGPRQLFFKNADESLIGKLRLEGTAPDEVVVTLEPAVRVTGRLIEQETSLPAERYSLHCDSSSLGSFRIDDNCRTGDDGRFEIKGLLAGVVYEMDAGNPQHFVNGKNGFQIDLSQAKPGDVVEIGDVPKKKEQTAAAKTAAKMKPRIGESALAAATPAPEAAAGKAGAAHAITVRGKVVDPDGRPAAGAFVAVSAISLLKPRNLGDELLGEATTDSQGRFELPVTGVSSQTYAYPKVFARTNESAIAWAEFNLDEGSENLALQLQPQQLIEGQLVDLEGQPAAGVEVNVTSVMNAPLTGSPANGLLMPEVVSAATAGLKPFTTDAHGRFAIRNVAAGHGVGLETEGTDRFAPQDMLLNTGLAETRGESDGTYRSYVKNLKPGEKFTVPLAPATIFEGVVLLGDSDRPAANARIEMWASQQEYGSMVSVYGRTDAAGRFRLNPKPGIKFGIIAHPPEGAPFHVKQLNDLRWSSGPEPKSIEIRLPAGVLAHGTIVDAVTGAPLANAAVQYYPDQVHNSNITDDMIVRWQGVQRANESGEFRITVPPGPGTLVFHAQDSNYVLEERTELELSGRQPGGPRIYAHAFAKIDPVADQPMDTLSIEVTPGETVSGRLVDGDGRPIEKALMVSRLKIVAISPQWRGWPDDIVNGRFDLGGLVDGVEYPAYFVDVERGLGASAVISAADPAPTIVLEPCGSAVVKFVDQDGEPAPGNRIGVHMEVTPGVHRFDYKSMREGQVAADEDFYSNVLQQNEKAVTTDEEGRTEYRLLIPGAKYRIYNKADEGGLQTAAEFTVEPGETRDLGEIRMQID